MTCVGFKILRVPDITRLETETYEASKWKHDNKKHGNIPYTT